MRHYFPVGEGASPFLGRGDVKFIILELLQEKPKHGYEIIKDIEARFGGLYSPSPGSVYPTLQMLEDQGYVTCSPEASKKVYQITEEGDAFLDESKEAIERINKRLGQSSMLVQRRRLGEQMRRLGHAVFYGTRPDRECSQEQLRKVRAVLSRAREEVENILVE